MMVGAHVSVGAAPPPSYKSSCTFFTAAILPLALLPGRLPAADPALLPGLLPPAPALALLADLTDRLEASLRMTKDDELSLPRDLQGGRAVRRAGLAGGSVAGTREGRLGGCSLGTRRAAAWRGRGSACRLL